MSNWICVTVALCESWFTICQQLWVILMFFMTIILIFVVIVQIESWLILSCLGRPFFPLLLLFSFCDDVGFSTNTFIRWSTVVWLIQYYNLKVWYQPLCDTTIYVRGYVALLNTLRFSILPSLGCCYYSHFSRGSVSRTPEPDVKRRIINTY